MDALHDNSLNKRKPIRLRNRSNYFIPDKDRAYIIIGSPFSYQSKRIKIEGYESRLYWEYRYCADNDGQTFFYTLTYSDKNIPKYTTWSEDNGVLCKHTQNVFDYKDLVWLLNGAFKKMLLRKYGTNFKYFVGAELGEGAGVRGYANNPHYHILFFLRSAGSTEYPYRKISEREFTSLIRQYWQGFDEGEPFRHHRQYRYGIVKESDKGALVSDFRAISYVSKYVTKDVVLRKHERKIYSSCYHLYERFYNVLNRQHVLSFINRYQFKINTNLLTPFGDLRIKHYEWKGIMSQDMYNEFLKFSHECIEAKIKDKINEYRNRYCNKCRISNGVGDYALEQISDEMNPSIKIPTKKGIVNRPISQYYYRKLYTDVVKDVNGNSVRVLNAKGIEYQKNHLIQRLEKMKNKMSAKVQLLEDPNFYEKLKSSDLNDKVSMTYEQYKSLYKNLTSYESLKRYAEYKLIYEHRFCEVWSDGPSGGIVFDNIAPLDDFSWFIQPSFYQTTYDRSRVESFLENHCKGYISYNAHPYFLCYMRIFDVFDLLSDYLFVSSDAEKERECEEVTKVRKFHVARKL